MRYTVLGLLLLLAACRKDEAQYEQRFSYFRNIHVQQGDDTVLRVMTYNIQLGFPAGSDPWNKGHTGGTPAHIDTLATFLKATGVDIIALQEVPLNRSNIVVKELLDSLAHKLQMNYAFGAHGYNDAYGSGYPVVGQWGCAILSNYPIESIDNREVSYLDVWTRRSTLKAHIRLNATKVVDVYSLHHKPMQDYTDLRKTADFVHESSGPAIVCGDFNTGPDMPTQYLQMLPSIDPRHMAIDMIFHTSEFQALGRTEYPTLHLSDHTPILVRFKY